MKNHSLAWRVLVVSLVVMLAHPAPAQLEPLPDPHPVHPAWPHAQPDAVGAPCDPQLAPLQGATMHNAGCACCTLDQWQWHLFPANLIWQSYLAGKKEPRIGGVWMHDADDGWMWDVTLGARAGLVRYGTSGAYGRPEGWQWDLECAAMPRLNLEQNVDVDATDFRFGSPLTYGLGAYQTKFAIYHLSSHVGDEFLVRNPTFTRINYSRNALVWGHSYFVSDAVRTYLELGYAFDSDVSRPWEYQVGLDYCPAGWSASSSAPFAAINAHLRQEVDFGGNLVLQVGWQWRDRQTGRSLRAGVEYFNGKSDQFEFYDLSENKLGVGLWYDF